MRLRWKRDPGDDGNERRHENEALRYLLRPLRDDLERAWRAG